MADRLMPAAGKPKPPITPVGSKAAAARKAAAGPKKVVAKKASTKSIPGSPPKPSYEHDPKPSSPRVRAKGVGVGPLDRTYYKEAGFRKAPGKQGRKTWRVMPGGGGKKGK